ncbi:SDR family NAD(P)-dependent oxidoreductase [Phenylobacterium sp. LjRoot225]|uniref:SDR family NAD(P)-dependent oxidoreductase n=1 Tax=Phenylobacterium sp. LjRoot225 TaxID=3342285 RepID=UPI003ECDECCF
MSDGQVAIVTGAAGGIGEAICRRFGAAGVRVVATGRSADKLAKLRADLEGGTELTTIAVDITAEEAPRRVVDHALATYGRLDHLVSNAAAGVWGLVHETSDAMLDEVLNTSLRAPFRLCREALPHLSQGSSIVHVGSTYGIIGGYDGGAYSAAKAGLIGLMRTMAAQYGHKGIRSNVVAPGVIRTAMTDAYWDHPGFQRMNQEMTPYHREGTPEDIANVVVFICSPEGSYIHGQTISLDGGWSTTKYLVPEALNAERVPPGSS